MQAPPGARCGLFTVRKRLFWMPLCSYLLRANDHLPRQARDASTSNVLNDCVSAGESTPQKHVVIGNPAPVALHTTPGKVVLVFCRNNKDVLVTTSLDFGQTWDKPRALPAASPIWGKNGTWPWYATGPPQGLQLPSGRLLVAADHRGFPASNHALVCVFTTAPLFRNTNFGSETRSFAKTGSGQTQARRARVMMGKVRVCIPQVLALPRLRRRGSDLCPQRLN
jgi:hypothetical protein